MRPATQRGKQGVPSLGASPGMTPRSEGKMPHASCMLELSPSGRGFPVTESTGSLLGSGQEFDT